VRVLFSVGGRDTSDLLGEGVQVTSGFEGGSIRTRARASLQIDPNTLAMIDWRQPVTVRTEGNEGGDVVLFSGFLERATAEPGGNSINLALSDPTVVLEEGVTGGAFGSGISPAEMLFYIMAITMPENTDPKYFQTGPDSSLADQQHLFRERTFTFVAPLTVVAPPSSPIRFLDGVVYTGSLDASYDERVILGTRFKEPIEEFAAGKTRIRFALQADGFVQAFEEGLQRLRKVLDAISIASNTGAALLPAHAGGSVLNFDRIRLDHGIREPDWLFVRDHFPGQANRHWLRWYSPHVRRGELSIESPHFKVFEQFLNVIATRSQEALTSRERALLSAVHALRRCRQASYVADALSLLWQSVEYLVAGFPAEPPMSKRTQRALVKRCLQEIRSIEPSAGDADMEEMEKHIRRGMNLVRSLPLKDKWNAICREFGLAFTKDEEDLLWKLRQARNDEIHGSEATTKRGDINTALAMVEKVILIGIDRARKEGTSKK
jgi:hypothetical protein